jgi:hypothetical protein
MAQIKKTDLRVRQIVARQWKQRWGPNYVAATFADAKEAPGISTGTVIRPMKMGEREFHTLSEPETFLALLALYHPDCWEAHEQFVLFPKPREHPLQNHPRAPGIRFKPFLGTLAVLKRLGRSNHPRVLMKLEDDPPRWLMTPFPFTGDLRLFMQDFKGAYCINWPVKNKYADFRQKGPRAKPRPLDDLDDPSSIARQELEVEYHSDAEIRTHPVSKDRLDVNVRLNLRNAFLDDSRTFSMSADQRADALCLAREAIGQDVPMYVVARRMAKEFLIEDVDAIALIHQGVWRRELRVDLFRPLLTTKPLHPEVTDVIDAYADWFAR